MTENSPVITTTAELARILTDFNTLLEQEQKGLQDSNSDQVEVVAMQKNVLLQRINHIHPDLAQRVSRAAVEDIEQNSIARIRQLIDSCKAHNRDNGALVAQGLKMCRTSIGFLSSNLNQGSVELYNLYGQASSEINRREIGQA